MVAHFGGPFSGPFTDFSHWWPKVGHQKWATRLIHQRLGGEWGVGVVKGWVSDFFIVKFEFPVLKLVSVPIFILIGRVSILGVGAGFV